MVLEPAGDAGTRAFFRLRVEDRDRDGDGLTDAEEALIGFDPGSGHTRRLDTPDFARATAGAPPLGFIMA